MKLYLTLGILVFTQLGFVVTAADITIQADKPTHAISPTLWGIFFEDINLSADGGIYPELVRNRSFEDSARLEYWKFTNAPNGMGESIIDSSQPLNPFNRQSLRIQLNGESTLTNDGYWGMNYIKGEHYQLKFAARSSDGFVGPITVKLLAAGKALGSGQITGLTPDWKYHTLDLTATDSATKGSLQLTLAGSGTLFLDMVSLMPQTTWKGHGLRPDLLESINDLHPSFLRFPGGCWVEGDTLDKMYHWKKTIGNIDVRTPLYNIWQYNATHGVGFHEYLVMCEDLGAEPLFDINCGMSHRENVPLDRMDQWVQDALDAIEYANGPTDSVWGARRAQNGHPAPFHLKYMEIGNENGGSPYQDRWPLFVKAIRAKYPEMHLIANHWQGGYPKQPMPQIVDEHYYNTPEWFLQQAHHYDTYARNGPKIFVGEYAVTRNGGLGNLRAAIGEAAFMTGIERNSDVVSMACYAPLFCNANHKRWPVNLINFDSSRWFGIPSYYVQKLFSEHRGDVALPTTIEDATAPEPVPTGKIGVGTWNTEADFKDIKVTDPKGKVLFNSDFNQHANDWKQLGGGKWTVADGALRQSSEKEFVRAIAGDPSWTDYTLELKARKLSGREGFMIYFHIGNDEDRIWWNVGGWQNTHNALELGEIIDSKPGHIETNRWYNLKIEVVGHRIKCWLDGQLIHDVIKSHPATPQLFASATRATQSGDLIVKIVNSSATTTTTQIHLHGITKINPSAMSIVLTSPNPKDENTLEEPNKVFPKVETINLTNTTFTRTFPANSLTTLRINTP